MIVGFIVKILATIFKMFLSVTRRGSGIFKILFSIDDIFRRFTMSLMIPLLMRFLFPQYPWLITVGLVLGLIIDVEDFLDEISEGWQLL